jgi:hypothetical protein
MEKGAQKTGAARGKYQKSANKQIKSNGKKNKGKVLSDENRRTANGKEFKTGTH